MSEQRSLHIGYALGDPSVPFRLMIGYTAREYAAQHGMALTVAPATTTDQQTAIIEQFVHQQLDAIIISPVKVHGLGAAIKQAQQAGIPVLVADMEIDDATVECTVRSDHAKSGELAAMYIAERLGGRGNVINIQGALTTQASIQRSDALHRILDVYPNMSIVFEDTGEWRAEQAAALVRRALRLHPDVQAIYAANDSMALGVLDALDELGRAGDMLVVGCDGDAPALQAIQQGRLSATVQLSAQSVAQTSIDLAARMLRHQQVPLLVVSDVVLITNENLLTIALETVSLLPMLLRNLLESSATERQMQEAIITAQRSTIETLSTPIVPVTDDVLVMPLVGTIDSARAMQIMDVMLTGIATHHARVIIVDITGVSVIDTAVANYLIQATRAARLLGTTVVLVGITPEVAQTMVQLGVELAGIVTRSNLQSGLEYALVGARSQRGALARR